MTKIGLSMNRAGTPGVMRSWCTRFSAARLSAAPRGCVATTFVRPGGQLPYLPRARWPKTTSSHRMREPTTGSALPRGSRVSSRPMGGLLPTAGPVGWSPAVRTDHVMWASSSPLLPAHMHGSRALLVVLVESVDRPPLAGVAYSRSADVRAASLFSTVLLTFGAGWSWGSWTGLTRLRADRGVLPWICRPAWGHLHEAGHRRGRVTC
jgi:hypothetical protein